MTQAQAPTLDSTPQPAHTEATLAPAAVVRVAAWPLSTLSELASDPAQPDLQVRLSHERRALWRATAGDVRFMRALSVSNPALAERVTETYAEMSQRTWNKSLRHLETTLLRTLSRAATRPQPCDLWAGTGLAEFGAITSVRPTARRVVVAPDLRPFATLLKGIARTPAGRLRGRFKLNPTLEFEADALVFAIPPRDRNAGQRVVVRRTDGLAAIVTKLGAVGATWAHEHVVGLQELGLSRSAALQLIAQLVDTGVLVGGIALPGRFASPWDALHRAAAGLPAAAAVAWGEAVAALEAIAARLAKGVTRCSPVTLRRLQARAGQTVATLAERLGLPVPAIPRAPLRCDAGVAFRVVLGQRLRRRIATSLRHYLGFQERFGIGWDLFRAAGAPARDGVTLANATAAAGGGVAPLWEDLLDSLGRPEGVRRSLQAWDEVLRQRGEVDLTPADADATAPHGAPVATYLVAPTELDAGAEAPLVLRGVLDNPTVHYARYTPLWSNRGRADDDPVGRFVGAALSRGSAEYGVRTAALVGTSHAAPNTAAQPDFGLPVCDPWAATPCTLDLREARVVDLGSAPVLWLGAKQPWSARCMSSANLAAGDPVMRALMLTGFFGSPIADMQASTVPFAVELESGTTSPHVRLHGDTVRSARTVLSGEELRGIVGARKPMLRIQRWRTLADRHDWPELVVVRRRGRPLVVPRDSILGVLAAFEGAGADRFVVVEYFDDRPWCDGHVAELSIPFTRPHHAWSETVGGGC